MQVIFQNKEYEVKLLGIRSTTYYYYFNPNYPNKFYHINKEFYFIKGTEHIILLSNMDSLMRIGKYPYEYFEYDKDIDGRVIDQLEEQLAV